MDQVYIGKCVQMAMVKAGINNPEMAKALKVTEPTVSNYRSGKVTNIAKLSTCAEICGMTFDEMMRLAE